MFVRFFAVLLVLAVSPLRASERNRFELVSQNETAGHFFSQVIYAPTANSLVSWGTRTHAHKIRAYEVQHFRIGANCTTPDLSR